MADKQIEETIRVVKFSGKKEDNWRMWNTKLRAIATIKRFVKALDAPPTSGLDMENPKSDPDKTAVKA